MRVHVHDAKGNRDRLVPLPQQTLQVPRDYWRLHQHPQLMFPNRARGLRGAKKAPAPWAAAACSARCARWRSAEGRKNITPHTRGTSL